MQTRKFVLQARIDTEELENGSRPAGSFPARTATSEIIPMLISSELI
jgi:hypothetical protein